MESLQEQKLYLTRVAADRSDVVHALFWGLLLAVDALLRHESGTPLHAAIASGVLFLINGALVLYVFSFDGKIKQR